MYDSKEKKLTIDEIAKLCGVSKTSISRYINGKNENLSQQTRERIARVMEETHYRPNRSAQRLKASKSRLIGCVIGDISSPFSAILLRGITETCDKAGYQVLIADCGNDPQKERNAIEGFLENRVDGLIINTSGGNDEFLISLEESRNVPIILADRALLIDNNIDTVETANRDLAKQCVKLLKDFGYEKIAFTSEGNKLISPRIRRCEGYLDGLREYYSEDPTPYILEFNRDIEGDCAEKMRQFIDKYPGRRLALLAVNGVTCQHILLAASELNIQFGYQFGLCSFDDWSWLKLAPPRITSVKIPTDKIGSVAADMLLEKINGKREINSTALKIEIPSELIVRESTKKILEN